MDDETLKALRTLSVAGTAARRLAVNLWKTHYSMQSPDWKLAPDAVGVIHQIDNMIAGLVKPVKPVPLPERREEVYQILRRCGCLPTIARDITDRIFRVIIGEQPNFRERMETFFRRHDMDDKQRAESEAGKEFLRGDKWSTEELKGGIHPAPQEFNANQLAIDPVLRYFHYAHLPPMLQPISRLFCTQARWIVDYVPRNAERTVALRKLLEAKDAAVRANVPPAAPVVPARQETFLDRLHKEYSELNEKKVKLWAFIASLGFLDLPAVEQHRLRKQHTVMDQYSQILIERISYAEHIQKSRDDQPSASADPDGDNVSWPGEGLDEDMRVTGGGKSEEPLPFKD